jgi:uncharacterized membrane protein
MHIHSNSCCKDIAELVDIEKEMELIRQKKSKLSANQRRMVVERYNMEIVKAE